MQITDKIYGTFDITSPVILELINSPTVQRLKHISQYGVPDEFYYIKNYSRYEHSIGVMLLLKKLGASDEEQIAGLLHDVAHTTFSHVIDWLYHKTGTEDSQDNEQASYVMKSEIPAILKKHRYDPEHISHHTSFSLLDREVPDLCADRIDYSVRQFPLYLAKRFVANLTVHENRIVFTDPDTALTFAYYFLVIS
jgi:HD superfamily phosphohydrolase